MDEKKAVEQEYAQCNSEIVKSGEECEEIEASFKKIEKREEEYQFIYTRTNHILHELPRYWDGGEFHRELGQYEEELFESNREITESLEDRKEELHRQKKVAKMKEEEHGEKLSKLRVQLEEAQYLWD